ncbi:hypothetical protein JOM56_014530 [Amanita muscaria]
MFKYWETVGKLPQNHEESQLWTKELVNWLTNNWRMWQPLAKKSNNFTVKKSEVLWNLHQEDVLKEIAHLLDLEEVTTSTPGWFPLRLPAIANILERLSPGEQAQLDADVERINKEGYPDDVKRRLAEKYTQKRVEDDAISNWKEKGVMTLTFTAYIGQDGKLVIDAHDHIADLMSAAALSFVDTYKNEVSHMKRLLMQYVKIIQGKADPVVPTMGRTDDERKISLERTGDGFPVLPNISAIEDYTKKNLEDSFKVYISQHYSQCQS